MAEHVAAAQVARRAVAGRGQVDGRLELLDGLIVQPHLAVGEAHLVVRVEVGAVALVRVLDGLAELVEDGGEAGVNPRGRFGQDGCLRRRGGARLWPGLRSLFDGLLLRRRDRPSLVQIALSGAGG